MFSRRIVAARPLARSIVPIAARPRPQFTQIRTALTDAEKANAELSDPNQVRLSCSGAQGDGDKGVSRMLI